MSQVSRICFPRYDITRYSVLYIYCSFYIFTYFFLTGSLRFGKVDVTEAQFTIIGIHLVSAIFGPKIWMMEVVFFLFFLIFHLSCWILFVVSHTFENFYFTVFSPIIFFFKFWVTTMNSLTYLIWKLIFIMDKGSTNNHK